MRLQDDVIHLQPPVRRMPSPSRALAPTMALLATLLSIACVDWADPVRPDGRDGSVPDSARAAYRSDAAVLALRRVHDRGGADAASVRLPDTLVASLHEALLTIYEMRHPARDSVVEIYPVHAHARMNPYEIFVGVLGGVEWGERLAAGIEVTGQPTVDSLMQEYGLSVERTHAFGPEPLVVLRAEEPLNTPALAALFAAVPGARYAETNGYGGDGADIEARAASDGGWWLDYSVGWGDCPAGCIERHVWSFRVTGRGEALYVRSTGADLPTEP